MILNKMLKVFFVFLMLLLLSPVFGQNFIKDGRFQDLHPFFKDPCVYYSGHTFKYSSRVWKAQIGSPDIVTSKYNGCESFKSKLQIRDTCLGMILSQHGIESDTTYNEWIATGLIRSLKKDLNYFVSIDYIPSLCNKGDFNQDVVPFRILLSDSNLAHYDTVELFALKSSDHWNKAYAFFAPSAEFNTLIIQDNKMFFTACEQRIHRGYFFIDNVLLTNAEKIDEKELADSYQSSDTLRVYFSSGSAEIASAKKNKLIHQIKSEQFFDIDSIHIVGHTDLVDSRTFNHRLSLLRAKNTMQVLCDGIPLLRSQKIEFIGKSWDAYDKNKNPEEARRSDIVIYKSNKLKFPWYATYDKCVEPEQFSYLDSIRQAYLSAHVSEKTVFNLKNQYLTNQLIDAKRYIKKQLESKRIFIINEAHYDPYHRKFIGGLIGDLHKMGFKHLAVEALVDEKTLATTYKDPVLFSYLRNAKEIGIDLYPYDDDFTSYPNPDLSSIKQVSVDVKYKDGYENLDFIMNKRDYYQFIRIDSLLSTIPKNEKLIIHVGHGHGSLKQSGNWKPLGAYLKEKYGDLVLSVDQTALNTFGVEHNDFYRHYKNKMSIIPYTNKGAYVKKEFNPLTLKRETFYDLMILHPKRQETNKFSGNEKFSLLTIETKPIKEKCPCLMLVYLEGSNPNTNAAYSVTQVNADEVSCTVKVPVDKPYFILMKDKDGNIVYDINR